MFYWNRKTRRYEDSRGRPVPPEQIRASLEEYIESQKGEIQLDADQLLRELATAGAIALFFAQFRERVQEIHGVAGMLAYGGDQEMNPLQWARVGGRTATELQYLRGFENAVNEARRATDSTVESVTRRLAGLPEAQIEAAREAVDRAAIQNISEFVSAGTEALSDVLGDRAVAQTIIGDVVTEIPDRFDEMIWGEIGSRGRMYADSVYGTYENSVKAREGDAGVLSGRRVCLDDETSCLDCPALATDEYLPLDEIADIGDSECASRCRCWIEFNYAGVGPIEIEREIYAGV